MLVESYSAGKSGLPPADFRVSYRFFGEEEGGRKHPPHQHTRWDFSYDDEQLASGHYMIWPEFITPTGDVLPEEIVPMQGLADMFILVPEARVFHVQHLKPGIRGYFKEGARRVAVCEVVEILALHQNPKVQA